MLDNIPLRLKIFQNEFVTSLQTISDLSTASDKSTSTLIQWLMSTKADPYEIFYNAADALAMNSATGMASLCHKIHHAFVDDGDIAFILGPCCPMIVFDNPESFDPKNHPPTGYPPNTKFSALSDVYEFIKVFEHIYKQNLFLRFKQDIKFLGFNNALRAYYTNPNYAEIFINL
jgi:hypothetical protein